MTVLFAMFALNAAMITWAVVRKGRRDRTEAQSADRRARLHDALTKTTEKGVIRGTAHELDVALARSLTDTTSQVDLLRVLGERADGGAEETVRLRAAVMRCGLGGALLTQAHARSAARRGMAMNLLSKLVGPLAGATIAVGLRDADADVRLSAVAATGELANRRAADVLLDALASDRIPNERLVEQLGHPWAVLAVLARVEEPTTTEAERASMADALRLAGDPRAAQRLGEMVAVGSFEEQIAAVKALATCGDAEPATVEAVLVALAAPGWQLRAQAAATAGALGVHDAVPALEAALCDRAWWVRKRSADALAVLGEPGVRALGRVAAGPDRFASETAVATLGRLGRRGRVLVTAA